MGHLILVQDKTENMQVKWLFFKSWYIMLLIKNFEDKAYLLREVLFYQLYWAVNYPAKFKN